jgi:hypothetical protein
MRPRGTPSQKLLESRFQELLEEDMREQHMGSFSLYPKAVRCEACELWLNDCEKCHTTGLQPIPLSEFYDE